MGPVCEVWYVVFNEVLLQCGDESVDWVFCKSLTGVCLGGSDSVNGATIL